MTFSYLSTHLPHFTTSYFSVFRLFFNKDYEASLGELDPLRLKKIETIVSIIRRVVEPPFTVTPCHNDLNPSNLRFLENEVRAIDFDQSAQGDPYFDIANLVIFYCLYPVNEKILLATYLGRKPLPLEEARLYLMKQVAWINEALGHLERSKKNLWKYGALKVPPYNVLVKELSEGKPEERIEIAKVIINQVMSNFESQKFQNAVNLLNKEAKKL